MVSKLEVNIRGLLSTCEAQSKDETNFWRLKKYIKSLDTMIEELKESSEYSPQSISDYYSRLDNLKALTNYIESPATRKKLIGSKQKETGDDLIKELNQIENSKNYSQLRKELINADDNVRRRNIKVAEDMNQAMKFYSDIQEKITEDMLSLTRSLKEQTETANKIIKRDTEVVTKSTQISESNINSLSKEAEKLQEHSRRACKCWLWMMIGLVVAIFIFMVLFMKIMKKRS